MIPEGITLHIFNPETDFALGLDADFYTPPAKVEALRRRHALLPALYASPGDIILCDTPADGLPYADVARRKDLLPTPAPSPRQWERVEAIRPWGWNRAIRRRLLSLGAPERLLPTPDSLARLRALAHRRLTIDFHRLLGTPPEMTPRELRSAADALRWAADNPGGYLKAPWSSSGCGILRALSPEGRELETWVRGTIARQGSLMAEPQWPRRLDFATEWNIADGHALFLGYSIFKVDSHCQYKGNVRCTQPTAATILRRLGWTPAMLSAQRDALDTLVAPHYSGPAGVDCLCGPAGINPCVEINLRMTMGIVSLHSTHEHTHEHTHEPHR